MNASVSFPAIRSRMGSTDYFSGTITARDLATIAIPVKELEEWKQWSMEERIQRDIALQRVHTEIVPYLVNSADRFFGSLIILVYEPEVFEFESVADLGIANAPAAYSEQMSKMGVLTVRGGSLVALDGQHRLVALREVVGGGDVVVGPYSDDIASDEICVVFVRHESLVKTRRIFNKVNQHARPTSQSDDLITSEDDGRAIVARWLLAAEPPFGLAEMLPPLGALNPSTGELFVEWRAPQIKPTDEMLTTLMVVADSVGVILDCLGIKGFEEKRSVVRPADEALREAYVICWKWWSLLLEGFEPFRKGLANPRLIPEFRNSSSRWALAMRPAIQRALFRGIARSIQLGNTLDHSVAGLNGINWRVSEPAWRDIVINPAGKAINRNGAIELGGRVIGFALAADRMSDGSIAQLTMDYADAKGWSGSGPMPELPPPIAPIDPAPSKPPSP